MKTFIVGVSVLMMAAPLMAQPGANNPKPNDAKPTGEKKEAKPKGSAHLRVLHAVPDAGAADVYLDDKKVAENVAFKTISNYLPIDSGKTSVKLTAAGKADVLLEDSLTAAKDGYYTVAAYGTKDKALLTTQNDATGKADEKKARIRVFHLSPGAPPVDITTPSTRAKDGAADVIKKIEYGKDSTKLVEPGKITLQVRADGKIIKEIADVTLEAGKRYNIFAVGKAGATGAEAFDVIVKSAGQ
jgi:hypothetical protein